MSYKAPLDHTLDGKVFGYVKVLRQTEETDAQRNRLYECVCLACGKRFLHKKGAFVSGATRNCGAAGCRTKSRELGRNDSKFSTGYLPKTDCNGFVDINYCTILTEMMCRTRGNCKFYKRKECPADTGRVD